MAEQMKAPSLAAKMAKVMAAVNRIPKNGYNSHFNYKFATEADIADAIRGLLAENGIAFFPSVVMGSNERFEVPAKGGSNLATRLWLSTKFICTDTGETWESFWPGEGQDNADKGCYKSITGAEKYALMKTFLIPTGDDPENENDAERGTTAKKADQNQRQAAPPPAPPKQTPSTPPTKPEAPKQAEVPKPSLPPLKSTVISPEQVKRFWAIAHERNWKDEQAAEVIKAAGFASSKEITADKYDALITVLETELPSVVAANAG